ncbi:glycoside hydrolase domain-containing protein, partial [Pedobacter sp. HMWF019]|uniref:glycoside hydrolase domain-containing protein n=1 Tax=Pedobacter sp. HMWF019 TaxID=2056856 RepID=UPI0018EE9A0A
KVKNFGPDQAFIQRVSLNGKLLDRTWITHQEIINGGELVITAGDKPNLQFGMKNLWISGL